MDIVKILLATLAATSFMTAFSYVVSKAFSKLFKEPLLLNIIMRKLGFDLSPVQRTIAAWALHYFIGLIFVVAYEIIVRYFNLEVTWMSGLIFGSICGIIGILGWMVIFRLPEEPPKVHFKEYYIQLFIAHLIFGFSAIAVYKLFQ